jgi:membrane fusion protein, multidrug efflux system
VQADLEAAKANLNRVKADLDNISPKTPFNGIYQSRFVEIGDTVNINDKLAVIIDASSVKATADLSAEELRRIDKNENVIVDNGTKKFTGKITYQSASAEPKFHTFKIEVTIDNPNNELKDGDFVDLIIPNFAQRLHVIPTSTLILGDDGKVGVVIVDDQDKSVFVPIEIEQASQKGMLVKDLSDTVRIIKNGGQFIKNGQKVKVANPT